MTARAIRHRPRHPRRGGGRAPAGRPQRWVFRLYVAGASARSLTAISNLEALCEQTLPGRYEIEVVDLLEQPERARSDQIVVVPTVVRRLPRPVTRTFGDLSNTARARAGFGLPLP